MGCCRQTGGGENGVACHCKTVEADSGVFVKKKIRKWVFLTRPVILRLNTFIFCSGGGGCFVFRRTLTRQEEIQRPPVRNLSTNSVFDRVGPPPSAPPVAKAAATAADHVKEGGDDNVDETQGLIPPVPSATKYRATKHTAVCVPVAVHLSCAIQVGLIPGTVADSVINVIPFISNHTL
nr:hypothetical protein Iba_chr12dCG17480 [Ipomoea batatas]